MCLEELKHYRIVKLVIWDRPILLVDPQTLHMSLWTDRRITLLSPHSQICFQRKWMSLEECSPSEAETTFFMCWGSDMKK